MLTLPLSSGPPYMREALIALATFLCATISVWTLAYAIRVLCHVPVEDRDARRWAWVQVRNELAFFAAQLLSLGLAIWRVWVPTVALASLARLAIAMLIAATLYGNMRACRKLRGPCR